MKSSVFKTHVHVHESNVSAQTCDGDNQKKGGIENKRIRKMARRIRKQGE